MWSSFLELAGAVRGRMVGRHLACRLGNMLGMTFPSQLYRDCFIHHYKDPGSLSNNQDSMESNKVFFSVAHVERGEVFLGGRIKGELESDDFQIFSGILEEFEVGFKECSSWNTPSHQVARGQTLDNKLIQR